MARPAVTAFFMLTVKRAIMAENLRIAAVAKPAVTKPVKASEVVL
jgi:hypothetical protein